MNDVESHGWGRFPRVLAQVCSPLTAADCARSLLEGSLIPRGMGRSYGDSALASRLLSTRYLDWFERFDAATGLISCSSGVSLDDILHCSVPRGWFLPVTPGTRYVSVGGAIASDVHGKNHHRDGTLSRHVRRIELMLGNGERVFASERENTDLFRATCGGMGLTGVILSAELQLIPIRSSDIIETTLKLPCLDAILEAFETHADSTYSVAWIDCLARDAHLGRSLLMLGEHAQEGPLEFERRRPSSVPFDMPAGLLNRTSVSAFNALYYGRVRRVAKTRRVRFEPYFYPLDALSDWNRLYGQPGFIQYQCVLPKAVGTIGLREILRRIGDSGRGSFLAVLKAFGAANMNPLSFPTEGYTLALDFKVEQSVFELLDKLDSIVLHHGGRLYLTKDSRMGEAMFKSSYPRWQEFEETRARWHAHGRFASLQSRRLGLQ